MMPNPRLATRYAKSLLDLALERDQLEQVYSDMEWLRAVCKSNRDFVNLLRSPIINGDVKKKIITAVAGDNIGPLTTAFIALLVTKEREANLPEISNAVIEQYKKFKNIHTVKLTTASPLGEGVKQQIIDQVKSSSGYSNIEIEEKVNEDIIGGFVLQIEDQLIDASIAYDLKAISRQFDNNDFIYKVR